MSSHLQILSHLQGNQGKLSSFISYNTAGGKGFRAELFKLVSGKEGVELSSVFELLQSAFVVIDDVMDESDLRRGVECYYKREGMICLKYAQYFICALGRIMKNSSHMNKNKDTHMNQKDTEMNQKDNLYKDTHSILRDIYNKCLFNTCLGQILDTQKKDLEDYTEEMYNIIAELKTSIYSFYLPLSAGYAYKGETEPVNLYKYCKLIGLIFQMQDDYLNFFPEVSKKSGTDLQGRKLTFFTCKLIKEKKNYFKGGEVKLEIEEKVRSYFPEYREKIKGLIEEVEEIGRDISSEVHEFLMKLIRKSLIE